MKIRLPPQREHDFEKITVFGKTPQKYPPGSRFGTQNRRNSTPDAQNIAKIAKKSSFLRNRKSCGFLPAKKTQKSESEHRMRPKKLSRRWSGGMRGVSGEVRRGAELSHNPACSLNIMRRISCQRVHARMMQSSCGGVHARVMRRSACKSYAEFLRVMTGI